MRLYREERKNITQISKILRISWGVVNRTVRSEIEVFDPRNRWTKEEQDLLIELREQGLSRFRISKIIGKSVNQIKSRVQLLKLEKAKVKAEYIPRNPYLKSVYKNDLEKFLRLRYSNIKSRSFRLGVEFSIPIDEFLIQWEKQDGKCYYTNIEMSCLPKLDNSFSVDRVDSTRGYVSGNVVFCITWVNAMKSNASIKEFVDMCCAVVNHNQHLLS